MDNDGYRLGQAILKKGGIIYLEDMRDWKDAESTLSYGIVIAHEAIGHLFLGGNDAHRFAKSTVIQVNGNTSITVNSKITDIELIGSHVVIDGDSNYKTRFVVNNATQTSSSTSLYGTLLQGSMFTTGASVLIFEHTIMYPSALFAGDQFSPSDIINFRKNESSPTTE